MGMCGNVSCGPAWFKEGYSQPNSLATKARLTNLSVWVAGPNLAVKSPNQPAHYTLLPLVKAKKEEAESRSLNIKKNIEVFVGVTHFTVLLPVLLLLC